MSARPASRRERRERTRRSLLRAAAKVFCRRGLDASIDEVADEAGYTKGAFYANFSSKEELFLVMLDERFDGHLRRLDRALQGADDAEGQARAAALGFLRSARGDGQWPRLWLQFAAHAARDERFRRAFTQRQREMRERVQAVYERWAAQYGVAPDAAPLADITAMTFCMADGFLVNQILDPDLPDELYAAMTAVFVRGLEAVAAGWEPAPAAAA